MSADTTAHFVFVARNSFTEVSDIVVQYVIWIVGQPPAPPMHPMAESFTQQFGPAAK